MHSVPSQQLYHVSLLQTDHVPLLQTGLLALDTVPNNSCVLLVSCSPNRVISATGTTLVTRQLTLPCSATGYAYIDVASVDASLTKSSHYKRMKLPYAISPLAACITPPCANKSKTDAATFGWRMLCPALKDQAFGADEVRYQLVPCNC